MVVGTGSGLDSDSKFAKQDWIRTQENQSPKTPTSHYNGLSQDKSCKEISMTKKNSSKTFL